MKFYDFSWCFYPDFGWVSLSNFFRKIGINKNEKFSKYEEIIKNKVWDVVLLTDVAVIVKAPISVSFNLDKVLHNENEGAVIWGDGYQNYFLKGISFEKELFEKVRRDEKITGKEILNLKNVEQKRIIIEKLGWMKILDEVKSKTIDKNGEYELIECNLKDDGKNKARFVKVTCPSTQRQYVLRVDPQIDNALDAVAWTFVETKESYKLEKET